MPNTASANVGVINFGGSRFIHNASLNNDSVYVGLNAGQVTSTGRFNVGIGDVALTSLTTGSANACVGLSAGSFITTGSRNCVLGNSLTNLLTGSDNTILGDKAGQAYTTSETNNIIIGRSAVLGDNNTIRIGNVAGAPPAHTRCFIAAIRGVSVTGGQAVFINSSGQLGADGTQSASAYTNVSTTPYVVLSTDYYLSVDTSSLSITIQLPNAPATNRLFVVKDRTGSAATRNITVTTVGGAVNIDGAATYKIAQNFGSIQLLFNATSYEVF